ncbi:MAG: hypothetical protein K5900_14410 [Butyrivibrio sp.]|nr:hypothetical protein [Butyrivibrio sp.]
MYISKKNHILTDAMLATALINLVGAAIAAIIRLFVKRAYENLPDMLDSTVVVVSNSIAVVKMILVSAVFIYSYRKMHKLRNLIPKEEYTELAKMQEELNPKGISSLSIYSTSQLLQVWGFILIGVSFLQEMGGAMYQRFVAMLSLSVLESSSDDFVNIYNGTHGFKYMGMITAIIIAIFVTGVFIRDRKLKIAAMALILIFILAFALLQMHTITLAGRTIGIVWTSVIYHTLDTIGIMILAFYLRDK